MTELEQSVTNSIQAMPTVDERDAGTAALALAYARAIDLSGGSQNTLRELGPKLMTALTELGLTPKARQAVMEGDNEEIVNPLEKFRNRSAR